MRQINKNIVWNAVGNTLYNSLQWLITLIVTRKSGFEEAGILSLAMSLTLTFRTIAYFGIHNFLVSDSDNKYSTSDYLNFRIFTCMISFVLCALFSAISGYSGKVFASVILYMIFRISEGFSDLFQSILQKSERLDLVGMCLSLKALLTTVAFGAGFFAADSVNIGLCFMSISSILVLLLFELPLMKHYTGNKLMISNKLSRSLVSESLPVFVYTTEAAIIFNAPKYFLSIMTNETAVGIYSSVFSAALILQAAFQYIYTPFVTVFTNLYSKREYFRIKNIAIKIMAMFICITALYGLVLQIFGNSIFSFVFGEYEHYSKIIIPIILSVFFYSIITFVSILILIQRKIQRLIAAHTVGVIILIAASVYLVPCFGINGSSYSMIMSLIVEFIMLLLARY